MWGGVGFVGFFAAGDEWGYDFEGEGGEVERAAWEGGERGEGGCCWGEEEVGFGGAYGCSLEDYVEGSECGVY